MLRVIAVTIYRVVERISTTRMYIISIYLVHEGADANRRFTDGRLEFLHIPALQ